VAVAVLFLLATTLTGQALLPGQPLPLGELSYGLTGGSATAPGGDWLLAIIRAVFLVVMLLLPVYLLYGVFTRQGRRQLLKDLVLAAGVFAGFSLFNQCASSIVGEPESAVDAALPAEPEDPIDLGALPAFEPQAQEWVVTLTVVVLAALAVLAAYLVIRRLRNASGPAGPAQLNDLAREAQGALDALQAGGDLRDAVIRCYLEMSRVLQQEKGIRRQVAMTPREFEAVLAAKGLPAEPVRHLTRLFERSRYGSQRPSQADEQQAIASLQAIVAACGAIGVADGGANGGANGAVIG
jgi:hypothetical protein